MHKQKPHDSSGCGAYMYVALLLAPHRVYAYTYTYTHTQTPAIAFPVSSGIHKEPLKGRPNGGYLDFRDPP